MRSAAPGIVARVNATLRAEGIAERVRRARGYYQLHGGRSHRLQETGIYSAPSTYEGLLGCVRVKLEEAYMRRGYEDPCVTAAMRG